jgi:hypothetical protein
MHNMVEITRSLILKEQLFSQKRKKHTTKEKRRVLQRNDKITLSRENKAKSKATKKLRVQ